MLDVVPVYLGGRPVPVAREYAHTLTPEQRADLYACATDFRSFLRHWRFQSEEGHGVILLGDHLFPSQDAFIAEMLDHPRIYCLKARRLGMTTLAAPFAAWRLRFHPSAGRCHVFSRDEKAAKALLRWITFGLDNLPDYLQLPVVRRAAHTHTLSGDRTFEVYAASGTSGINQGCIHLLIDELARMPEPQRLWQRVMPTLAKDGTCHVLTVGTGPVGYHADLWHETQDAASTFRPVFLPASTRHTRFELELARRGFTSDVEFRREYPEAPADALTGGGELLFHAELVEAATRQAPPPSERGVQGRKYVTAWDIGSRRGATVGITLDVTTAPYLDVVGYRYLRGADYNQILSTIRDVARRFPGPVVVEENSMGAAVLDQLGLKDAHGFLTTKASKGRIIESLNLHLQRLLLTIPAECRELIEELKGYQLPDDHIHQDTVMALAIAIDSADLTFRTGRVLGVYVQGDDGRVEALPAKK